MRYLTFTLSLLVLPTMGSAHHSQAEFASEVQEIEAEIVEIAWRNPHPVLTVSVANDAGEPELWEVESWSSANSLARKGVVADVFEIGQTVRAAVRLSGRRPGTLLGESISLGNGTQAVLRPGYDPVFPGEAVLGSDTIPLVSASESDTSGQGLGLFRVWSHVDSEGPGELPLTAAALARQEVFVELTDHPMWHCDPIGMPLAMDTGAPIEFIDRGEEIHLRLEQNDSLRVIHLNPDIDPARKSRRMTASSRASVSSADAGSGHAGRRRDRLGPHRLVALEPVPEPAEVIASLDERLHRGARVERIGVDGIGSELQMGE